MTRRSTREAATRDPFGLLRLLRLLAGIVLLAAVSWEVLAGDNLRFSQTYLTIQLVVCLIFLADFFVRWAAAGDRRRFLRRNLLYLLISIPWLNISAWCGADMTHDWGLVVGMMPLVRAFLAMAIVVEWLVGDNRIHRLFAAYLFTVVVFTYLSALVFCVFLMVKLMNRLARKKEAAPAPAPAPAPTKEELLLTEIRDLLKEQQKR